MLQAFENSRTLVPSCGPVLLNSKRCQVTHVVRIHINVHVSSHKHMIRVKVSVTHRTRAGTSCKAGSFHFPICCAWHFSSLHLQLIHTKKIDKLHLSMTCLVRSLGAPQPATCLLICCLGASVLGASYLPSCTGRKLSYAVASASDFAFVSYCAVADSAWAVTPTSTAALRSMHVLAS